MNNKIFLIDEADDGYGYVCSEGEHDIYVSFWAENNKTIQVMYSSMEHLYKSAKLFVGCGLNMYSPNHIAQKKMYEAFIEYYENK